MAGLYKAPRQSRQRGANYITAVLGSSRREIT